MKLCVALLLCLAAVKGQAPAGTGYIDAQYYKDLALSEHNNYRREVAKGNGKGGQQPPASNMLKLTWNDQLAEFAKTHAAKCGNEHSTDAERDAIGIGYVGENLAVNTDSSWDTTWPTSQSNIDTAVKAHIQGWYDEILNFIYASDNSRGNNGGGQIGHYTQMVWWETASVGCGLAFCPSPMGDGWPSDEAFKYVSYLVCNYAPGGNMNTATTPVYTSGEACSACDASATCDDGLCATGGDSGSGGETVTTTDAPATTTDAAATTTDAPATTTDAAVTTDLPDGGETTTDFPDGGEGTTEEPDEEEWPTTASGFESIRDCIDWAKEDRDTKKADLKEKADALRAEIKQLRDELKALPKAERREQREDNKAEREMLKQELEEIKAQRRGLKEEFQGNKQWCRGR